MIDFKRLGGMTAADRAAREAKRVQDEKDADAKRRAEWSQTTIDARLSEAPELRATRTGDSVASLRCIGEDGEAFTVTYWLPPHRPEAAERIARTLRAGLCVRLAGYWKHRQWTDRDGTPQQVREFQAQYVAPVRQGAIDKQPAPPRGGAELSRQAGKVAPRCRGLGDFCGPRSGPRWCALGYRVALSAPL